MTGPKHTIKTSKPKAEAKPVKLRLQKLLLTTQTLNRFGTFKSKRAQKPILCARFGATHGVRGAIKVYLTPTHPKPFYLTALGGSKS